MKFHIDGDTVVLSQVGEYYDRIADTGQFKWNRRNKTMEAVMSVESLNALHDAVGRLPPLLGAHLIRLQQQDRMLQEQRGSLDKDPQPLFDYPVKATLMRHQIVGANMAMIVFGETDIKEDLS